jgi:hypothetical protein
MMSIIGEHGMSLIGLVAFFVASLWMFGRILAKAGYSAAWGLVMWVPVVNLVAVWVFAFVGWPGLRRAGSDDVSP